MSLGETDSPTQDKMRRQSDEFSRSHLPGNVFHFFFLRTFIFSFSFSSKLHFICYLFIFILFHSIVHPRPIIRWFYLFVHHLHATYIYHPFFLSYCYLRRFILDSPHFIDGILEMSNKCSLRMPWFSLHPAINHFQFICNANMNTVDKDQTHSTYGWQNGINDNISSHPLRNLSVSIRVKHENNLLYGIVLVRRKMRLNGNSQISLQIIICQQIRLSCCVLFFSSRCL